MTYSLSVVQICPDEFKAVANALAEQMGYGPDNLSVKLTDAQGGVWWGCHAWWIPEVYAAVMAMDEPEVVAIMGNVISSSKDVSDGHWEEVLDSLELTVYNETI